MPVPSVPVVEPRAALWFLVPLLLGFACDIASAFTSALSRRWGERGGQVASAVLRNILGIPVWVAGLIFAMRTPSPALYSRSMPATGLAWLLLLPASALQLWAITALRHHAAAPTVRDPLVQHGPYAHVRHPIYTGLLLDFVAIAIVRPTQAVALACGLGIVWVVLQARLEETDLLQRLPPYRGYMARVPRFFPRLGCRS